MSNIPLNLYYISQDTETWRRVYLLISDVYGSNVPHPYKSLDKRDLLPKYGIPIEAWIDLRILETWFREKLPIPLVSMVEYIFRLQRNDGSFSVDGVIPNSGATYRAVELATLLGIVDHSKVVRAISFLQKSLKKGGLASPGPVEGAILEVGTTARFMHVLLKVQRSLGSSEFFKPIEDMRNFLISRFCDFGDEAAWHTDLMPSEISSPEECITGATSLALYSLALLGKREDADKIAKVCKWLIRRQRIDGGWADARGGESNVDNTFNVVRALLTSKKFLKDDIYLSNRLEDSLKKAHIFLTSIDPYELPTVSLRAMLLRALILYETDPFEPKVIRALESIVDIKGLWYSKEAHLYNELLIVGISVAEWLSKVKERKENPYERAGNSSSRALRFLFSFPVEMPPFFQGYRTGVKEKFLNFLTETRCSNYHLIKLLTESITLKDIFALILAVFIMLGVFLNEDFINAIVLPERNHIVNIYSTVVICLIYLLWLVVKFKLRNSLFHFIVTTLISIGISFLLINSWLKYSNEIVYLTVNNKDFLPKIRLILTLALILDVGRRLINISNILDKSILAKKR